MKISKGNLVEGFNGGLSYKTPDLKSATHTLYVIFSKSGIKLRDEVFRFSIGSGRFEIYQWLITKTGRILKQLDNKGGILFKFLAETNEENK
jgi:hypothetical protein